MADQSDNGEKSLAFLEKSKGLKIIILLFIFTVGFSFLLASKYFQDGEFQVHDSIFDFENFESSGTFDLDAIEADIETGK